MGHDRVQGGEIIGADVYLVLSEQRVERVPAHTDIQTINTWTIKVGNFLILIARGGDGRERMHLVITVEKECIPQIDHRFDMVKRARDIAREECFVYHMVSGSNKLYPAGLLVKFRHLPAVVQPRRAMTLDLGLDIGPPGF